MAIGRSTVFALLAVQLMITGCGKRGPLIYPDMLVPAAPTAVSAQQCGKAVKLSFSLPSRDLAGRSFNAITGVKVLKRDEPAGDHAPGCSTCTADFILFKKLNLDLLPSDILRSGHLVLLLDNDVQTGRVFTYRISALAGDAVEGAVAATSTAAFILPAPLPPVLQVISQPTEIQLEFVGLPPHEGAIAGYNVYRTVKGEPFPLLPVNRYPLPDNRFIDQGLDRGVTYLYGVRTVVRLAGGNIIEGDLSNEAEGKLKDDE